MLKIRGFRRFLPPAAAMLWGLAPQAGATPWTTVGPRALGMGGAQVAIAEGPLGAYYNPGALGEQIENPSGFQIPAAGRYDILGNVIEGANDLFQAGQACAGAGASCTAQNIQLALRKLNEPGSGALAEAAGGLDFKFGRLAVFANNFTFTGASPLVDLTNNAPGTVANNQSKLIVRGGQFYEFGAGYGFELMESGLFLGANVKGIVGRVGFAMFPILGAHPEVGSVLRNFDRSAKNSFRPGIDVGMLWDARESFPDVWWRPRFGVSGRNVNNPRFDQPALAAAVGDRNRFSGLQGASRAGLALSPLRWWNIAADIDLTENLTMLDNYTSRNCSAGTEFNIVDEPWLNVPLRAGVAKNIASGLDGAMWTGGFGFNFLHVMFDFAGGYGGRFVQVKSLGVSERLPRNLSLSAQLAILFGGAEAISAPRRDPFAQAPAKTAPAKVSPTYDGTPSREPFRR